MLLTVAAWLAKRAEMGEVPTLKISDGLHCHFFPFLEGLNMFAAE